MGKDGIAGLAAPFTQQHGEIVPCFALLGIKRQDVAQGFLGGC